MTRHLPETERKAQILAAARDVFVERGYVDTRVDDVARRAHLSKGAVYFYFASKSELFAALVLSEHEETYRILDTIEHSPMSALEKLVLLGTNYIEYFTRVDHPPRFFLLMTELATRDAQIREECQALHQRFIDAVARILAQGMAEGTFRSFDPIAIAQLLKAMIDGLSGEAAIAIEVDRVRLATDGFQMLLRGILANPDAFSFPTSLELP